MTERFGNVGTRHIFLAVAIFLFALAGIGVTFGASINFVAIGLAFLAASLW